MSVTITMKLEGADKLTKALAGMPGQLREALGRALTKAAFFIEREAKKVTPVDTGRLRSSIFTVNSTLQSEVSTNTEYAVYVHEGTRYMSGRPFMTQGAQAASGDIQGVVEQEVSDALDMMIK